MNERVETLVEQIRDAARHLDREEVDTLCGQLIGEARRSPLPPGSAVAVLKILQRKRYFAQLQAVGDALIETGQADLEVRRRWLQSLIDQSALDRAVSEAERLAADAAADRDERPEARGLLGRALKQRYVSSALAGSPDADALRRAIQTYAGAYYGEDDRPFWHGINTAALLARARRDGIPVDAPESPRQLASALLRQVEGLGAFMNAWAMATGLEACVALGQELEAVRWANGYAAHPGADAFELASTLRQLEEVWQLDAADGGMGAAVLPILRSGLLRREDGSVRVTPYEVRQAPQLEKVLGRDAYVSLTWYREGLERARGVARLTWPTGQPLGTGFLVRGRDLAPRLPDEWLLLTNHHVVNTDPSDTAAARPDRARVTFSALSDDDEHRDYGLERTPVWSSRELDAILLRLSEVPRGVPRLRPYRIAEAPPIPGEHTRVYVIGHPHGQVLSFSIHDNQLLDHRAPLLHYRAPTDPGSSGSPIFDRDWDLVGLHHAGDHRVRRLHGTGTYAANEGIWIQSIRGAIGGTPPRVDVQPAPAPQPSLRETRTMNDLDARIRDAVKRIERDDPDLAKDMEGRRAEARDEARKVELEMAHEGFAPAFRAADLAQETIVLRVGRPVLRIANDDAVLDFSDAESRVWRERLLRARERLIRGARAVGRVEVEGHELDWIGTGVLVAPDVIATNRHVAEEFGHRGGAGFVFRPATVRSGAMSASIDFLEELGRNESRAVRISRILHIENASGPDLALLQVEGAGAQHVKLARDARRGQQVAVIGYPARDSRIPDVALMDRIFGDVYDKKRLAPGQLTGVEPDALRHDCTTLGGNSGSPVFSLDTGEVVGLHFAGRFLEANFAVPARLVADRLRAFRPDPDGPHPDAPIGPGPQAGSGTIHVVVPGQDALATVTIPLQVTVTVGTPVIGTGGGGTGGGGTGTGGGGGGTGTGGGGTHAGMDDDPMEPEARPEDYADRPGYDPRFLGSGAHVPLPVAGGSLGGDVLRFQLNGREEYELRYQHFSVVMSRSRRLCLFSAVNIDGRSSVKRKRVGWRLDPRIPEKAQIRGECYGSPPKFSRGHMTRREDPVWGDGADLGNADSMHVTNAVPQMQPFNGGVWLGLEDYALDNAREDDMRISVFTGPILRDDDPVRDEVRIPRSFWKVIAFIHDRTGKLSATGYWMSQEKAMRPEEFIFGQYETAQRPIAWIEEQTGLSFGPLAKLDPMRDAREARPTLLTRPEDIRFL